jgi:Spy/CpxP family protein refolding chaperone
MRGMGPGGPAGGLALLRSFHALNLTEAQQTQVHGILAKAQQTRQAAMQAMRANGPGNMAALANPGDPNYAAAVQAAKKRATDRIQQASDLHQQLYGVLTAEQKSQLSKMIADRRARLAQWSDRAKGQSSPVDR